MPGFYPRYFIIAAILLLIEVLIALYVHDAIIRPWGGDFLVVILLYCLVKSFLHTRVVPTALAVLVFSYIVEVLQYFNLVGLLGLEKYTLARVIIGTSFQWTDLLAYTLGIGLVLLLERKRVRKSAGGVQ